VTEPGSKVYSKGQNMQSNEDMKKLKDELAALRSEVAALEKKSHGDGHADGHAVLRMEYTAPPSVVSDAEVEKLAQVIENAINDPREGLARVNKQYVRPVLEVIAATTELRFSDTPDLPKVKEPNRNGLRALRSRNFDESTLDWNPASATADASTRASNPNNQ
jgi:hypothetical protein